jgi:integrase/recombinase XerC
VATELVPIEVAPGPTLPSPGEDLVSSWLAGRSPRTLKAYSQDLRHFVNWLAPSGAVIDWFLSQDSGIANGIALAYRASMLEAKLAPATIARRLASLRSFVKLARTLGRVDWALEVDSPRAEARRDVRGPEAADRKKLWKSLDAAGDGPKARRDRAIVALLFDRGLRRGEALALDLADVDLKGGTVAVVGKGRTEKERLTIAAPTRKALASWLEARGEEPGPLFYRMDRGSSPDRLTGDGLARTLAAVGRRAKLSRPLRPHGLRHAAITAALDSGADVRSVRRFSRHVKIETVMRYDDDRSDVAGEVSARVARERK